jgi:hypothetical protein
VLLVELVGTLNNLTVFDLPRTQAHPNPKWSRFVREYDLISFVSTFLVPEMAQNDVSAQMNGHKHKISKTHDFPRHCLLPMFQTKPFSWCARW